MSNLQLVNKLTLDSREVAEMVHKNHADLLRDIRRYSEYLIESKIALNDFFIENTYIDSIGRTLKCYEITKKGCEFIAHKLTGQKGAVFTATYINKFHEMESELSSISKGGMQVVTLIHKEVGELIAATTEIEDRVSKLEEEDFIKPFQKKALINARTNKVFSICGGKQSQAYQNRSFRSRIYQDIFRNIKNIYNVNEYDAIPKYKFVEALKLINEYSLPLELKYELEKINNQIMLSEVACGK